MTSLLAENLAFASLALLLVLLIRRPVAELFGAGWAYALWLLPALRLVAPPLPVWGGEFLPPLTTVIGIAGDAAASVPPQGGLAQWVPMLLAVWAAGASAFLVWQWFAYRDFLTRLSLSARSAGAHRGLPLVASSEVDGPMAVGLLDRRIVVPSDFLTRYSPAERRLAVEHEWVHHRRGDIWWNLVAILFLAANWFNPLAWVAFRYFRTDQELACDSAVAASASPEERHDYARALVKSASRPGLIAACPLNSADQLKRRLKMMNSHRKSPSRTLGGVAALAGALCATAVLGTAAAREGGREGLLVMQLREGQAPPSGPGRSFTITRGPDGEILFPEGCSARRQPLPNASDRENRNAQVVFCGPRSVAMSDEQRLRALEQLRAGIAERPDQRGVEHRSQVIDTLDREIARLRRR